MAELKKGDTVRLKSGGPLMTVSDVGNFTPLGPEDGVKCVWFEKTRKEEDVFESAVLEKSDNRLPTGRLL